MRMPRETLPVLLLCLCMVLCLAACGKRQPQRAAHASLLPHDSKLLVAPFNQPRLVSQLIAGQLPEGQGHIALEELRLLDADLARALHEARRAYASLPPLPRNPADIHESGTAQGLEYWLNTGRVHGADLLLVPQVLDWHERQGSRAGVTTAAHVRVEFFLLDVARGRVWRRAIFEERQVGLVDDMSRLGAFFRRGGGWVEARELAREGIEHAVKELGL